MPLHEAATKRAPSDFAGKTRMPGLIVELAAMEQTNIPEKSLMRMFGPKGNPSSQNMFGVIAELAKAEGVNFSLKAKPTV